ncbi:hypothetical protein FRX31_031633 [Thalictrum thalictroides]|uniref:F-box associated beta-propeller type 1 domain-containing protein n=1 Tax=Thalictrum thalictroides TaxID=46969 RepID=A0A7J6V3R7_THATH|nr:hypothetical protein FRX31_031633 [Thalictrum thalictroides]
MIPQHPILDKPAPSFGPPLYLSYGFFCDSISCDYKLLKIITLYDSSRCYSQVMVYSFGENCWTRIGDIPYMCLTPKAGKLVNGVIHWLAFNAKFTRVLVAFESATKTFSVVSLPEYFDNISVELTELAGCISLVRRDKMCEVWLLKNYDRKESWTWTKLFAINPPDSMYNFNPLYITSKGDLLVQICGKGLFLYNQERLRQIDIVEKHPAIAISNETEDRFWMWQLNYFDSLTGFEISDGEYKNSSGERSSPAHMKLRKDAGVLFSETQ